MANRIDSKQVVIVTGDVTIDWNLARTRRSDEGASMWNTGDWTRAYWRRGGAALLADVIKAVAALVPPEKGAYRVHHMEMPKDLIDPRDRQYHHSYATWSPH